MKSISIATMALALALTTVPAAAQTGMPTPLPAEGLADAPNTVSVAWLKSHIVVSGPVTGGLTFAFPKSVYANRLFLLGESHGSATPQIPDLELLAHLNPTLIDAPLIPSPACLAQVATGLRIGTSCRPNPQPP